MIQITIYGPGCRNCRTLEDNAKQAISELSLKDVVIEKAEDIKQITEAGVMTTPALAIDGEIKSSGRIPDREEIKGWLQTE